MNDRDKFTNDNRISGKLALKIADAANIHVTILYENARMLRALLNES